MRAVEFNMHAREGVAYYGALRVVSFIGIPNEVIISVTRSAAPDQEEASPKFRVSGLGM